MASYEIGIVKKPSQNGRTWRWRRKKRKSASDCLCCVDCWPVLVKLSQWLHGHVVENSWKDSLKPAVFSSTGRGLMTVCALKAGDVIVSVPRKAMVTCSDVLGEKEIIDSLKDSSTKLKAMEILSLFLVIQRYLGNNSKWKPYIDSLPSEYTVPLFCSEEEVKVLPNFLKCIVEKQKKDVYCCFTNTKGIFSHLCSAGVLSFMPSLLDIRWAWFTVNTRAVYLKNEDDNPYLADDDVYALAPYLDLLNHSHTAQVDAYLNKSSGCYEIKTLIPFKSYEQVFINYGPHDNIKLYSEYGFLLPDNPHNSVPFTFEESLTFIRDFSDSRDLKSRREMMYEKQKLILSQSISDNLAVSSEGPSWNFEVLVTIFLMTSEELCQWQVVYHDLSSVCHRLLVLECLKMVCKNKLALFTSTLMDMDNAGAHTEAFAGAKSLVKEWCSILVHALECI